MSRKKQLKILKNSIMFYQYQLYLIDQNNSNLADILQI